MYCSFYMKFVIFNNIYSENVILQIIRSYYVDHIFLHSKCIDKYVNENAANVLMEKILSNNITLCGKRYRK